MPARRRDKSASAAPPDGYTLIVGGLSNIVFNAGLYKNLPYDPLNDLVPVALVINISYTLVGQGVALFDAKGGHRGRQENARLDFGRQAGVGTGQHMLGAAFQDHRNEMLEVPYRGSSPAYPDLLSGRVDLFVDSTPAAMPYIKSGQAKGIGILAASAARMPDVPTMTESGVPGLEINSSIGISRPPKRQRP